MMMLKQTASVATASFSFCPPTKFNDHEIEVAGILLEIPRIVGAESKYGSGLLPFSWGAKRKRSDAFQSTSASPSLPPSPEKPYMKVEASSPATPLSFSPSESDEKPLSKRRKRKIKSPEEWSKTIQKQLEVKELLNNEVQKLLRLYEKLTEKNLALKTRRQELMFGIKHEVPQLEVETEARESLDLEMKLGLLTVKSPVATINNQGKQRPQTSDQQQHQQHITMDVEVIKEEMMMSNNGGGTYPKALSLFPAGGLGNSEVPRRVPGLNAYSGGGQCCLRMDTTRSFSRLMAAQARQRRMQICREKNSNSSNKLRLSIREKLGNVPWRWRGLSDLFSEKF